MLVSEVEIANRNDYYFLSNYYPEPVFFNGIRYSTAEHAYQASKVHNPEDSVYIARTDIARLSKVAFHFDQAEFLHPNWEEIRMKRMEEILQAKFYGTELGEKLLLTDDSIIMEHVTWDDRFWGYLNKHVDKNFLQSLLKTKNLLKEKY